MIASMSENGTRQSVFVYDPLSLGQEIVEYDGNSDLSAANVQRIYLRLPGSVDQPFLMIDYAGAGCGGSGCEHWAYADQRGSIIATTDENGDIRNQYAYSPYGVTNDEGGIPFKYTGQKYDSQSGLYYYKARWYDPETGRFLQPDPIGYGDGMNMYAYVSGDPVNFSDLSGRNLGGSLNCIGCFFADGSVGSSNRRGGSGEDASGGGVSARNFGGGFDRVGTAQACQGSGCGPTSRTTFRDPFFLAGQFTGFASAESGRGRVNIDCRKQSPDEIILFAPAEAFNLEKQPTLFQQLAVNQRNGDKAELLFAADLLKGGEVPTRHVSFSNGGVTAVLDIVATRTVGNSFFFRFFEVKFNSASLRSNQRTVFPGIETGTAVPFGPKATRAKLIPGATLATTTVENSAGSSGVRVVRVCPE